MLHNFLTCVYTIRLSTITEHQRQKLFVRNLDPAVLICVELSEGLSKGMQRDTSLDEIIKGNGSPSLAIKFPNEHGVEVIRQSVSEARESSLQFIYVDSAGVISVVRAEGLLPVCHIFPQRNKFLKVYCSGVVSVEHPYHKSQSLISKRGPCSI